MILAPVCLFTYNRLRETQQTVEALQKNYLAKDSELIIFSDGPKNANSKYKVEEVRQFLRTIRGFKSIEIIESPENKGLANSIIDGVTQIINRYGKIIVLEDDLVTTANFLNYMNSSLNFYQNEKIIFSISGFSVKITLPNNYDSDIYFYGRSHSWGWATWKDRWETIDWELCDFENFKNNKKIQRDFNRYGSDLKKMLVSAKKGKVDSWYIRFTYNQFLQKRLCVFPTFSKVINIGFMRNATHTNTYNRVKINLDISQNQVFKFQPNIVINKQISRQVYRYKSLPFRIVGKFFTILLRLSIIKQRKST